MTFMIHGIKLVRRIQVQLEHVIIVRDGIDHYSVFAFFMGLTVGIERRLTLEQ